MESATKITSFEGQLKHVEAQEKSGMSKSDYCKKNGINLNTFYGWERNVKMKVQKKRIVSMEYLINILKES